MLFAILHSALLLFCSSYTFSAPVSIAKCIAVMEKNSKLPEKLLSTSHNKMRPFSQQHDEFQLWLLLLFAVLLEKIFSHFSLQFTFSSDSLFIVVLRMDLMEKVEQWIFLVYFLWIEIDLNEFN